MKLNMLIILSLITFCIADQRHFVWTYEYKTVKGGEAEFEHYYTTSYPNASDLSVSTKTGHQLEMEIGMNEKIDFAFLYFFLTSIQFEQFLYANLNPTCQPGIYLGTLGGFKFILPPKPLI